MESPSQFKPANSSTDLPSHSQRGNSQSTKSVTKSRKMLHAASPTSFGRSNPSVYSHPATSSTSGPVTMFDSNSMMDQDHDAGNFYYVQEPRTKRHHEGEDMFSEYAPRQKRKFDRISERFQNFSISKNAPLLTGTSTMDTSSDEEFDDGNSPMGIVQEPEEEDEPPKKIRIDEKLKAYLERARQAREPFLPRLHHSVKGDEVAVWRPTGLRNPFDDPSMQGRISEIEEPTDEEDWQDDAAVASFPDETSTEPDELGMSSADDSPVPTPPIIEEVPSTPPDFSPRSEDDDGMDID